MQGMCYSSCARHNTVKHIKFNLITECYNLVENRNKGVVPTSFGGFFFNLCCHVFPTSRLHVNKYPVRTLYVLLFA